MKNIEVSPILKMMLLAMITECNSLPLSDKNSRALVSSSEGSKEHMAKSEATNSDKASINEPGSATSRTSCPSQVRMVGPLRPLAPKSGYAFGQHNTGIRRHDEVRLRAAPPVVVLQEKENVTHNIHAANRVCIRNKQAEDVFFEELVRLTGNYRTCLGEIKSLLKSNEDSLQQGYVSFVNGSAYTVLHYLAEQGATELVQYLIEDLQIDPDVRNGEAKITALQYAAYQGHLHTVRYLISKGASLNHRDRHHKSVIFYAVTGGQLRVATYLVEAGASMEAMDNIAYKGFNLLHTAIMHHDVYFVVDLLDIMQAKDVDVINMANQRADLADWATPLSLADVRYGEDNLVSVRLKAIISGSVQKADRRKWSEHGEVL